MAEKKSDVLEPRFDGALIRNKYVKAGLFIVKTKAQRNAQIKTLYRELDGETTTLCYVSADRAIYELIANPSSEGTTDQDWEKLDFGVSDILIAKGNWEADNSDPVLSDAGASGNGNDFYVVTGAPTPVQYQDPSVFGGAEVTITNGDWVISNGEEWFTTGAPINWDAISGIPTVISEYIAGTIYDHQHEIDGANGVNGLQTALDLKFDESNTVEGDIDPATELDAALTDVLFIKTNYYNKGETYSQSEIDTMVGNNSPLSTKGDIYTHNGTVNARLPIGTDGFVLVADAAEALGMKWAAAAETGWKTAGETVLTAPATITHNHHELIHDLGALELSGFSIIADLDTSLQINLFRFNHQALSDHTEGFTETYFGSNNGNSGSEAWGNIMFGQNNANSLLATGEWAGGRNIIAGFNNGDGFSSLSTHNIIFGRKNASGAGEVSYGVLLGYEVLNGATSTAPDGKQNVNAIGVWTMQNFAFNAEVGTEAYNSNITAIGTEAGANGVAIYDAGNTGTDRGGALDSLLLGTRAGYGASIEKYEIIIGSSAGNGATIGRGNILIGTLAGASMTGGLAGNTGIGETIFNTLIGTHTGENLSGNKNSFYGTEAGSTAVAGNANAGFGNWALNRVAGNDNAGFGTKAGYNGTTSLVGSSNLFLGALATYDASQPLFDDSIVLATNHTQVMVSNKIYIGSATQNVIFNGVLTENNAETQLAVINSTTGELEYRTAESLANETAGIDGAIQYSESSLHAADDAFTFNSAKKWLNMDATGAHTAIPRWSLTMGDDINTIGAGSGSLAWSAIFGDVFVFDNAGTSRSISNILSTGTGNTITIANGAFGIYSSAFLGAELTIEPSLAGTNYQGSIIGGTYNTSRNGWQYVGGQRADVLGLGAFVHGQGENVNRLFSDGNWSINMSINTVASTYGEGANAISSAIIGGQDHHIPSDSLRSVIIGGNALKMPAATTDTVLVENLMVNGALTDLAGNPLGWALTGTTTLTDNAVIQIPNDGKTLKFETVAGGTGSNFHIGTAADSDVFAINNTSIGWLMGFNPPTGEEASLALKINIGGFEFSDLFGADTLEFVDARGGTDAHGLEYKNDYILGYTARTLTDKGYDDSHIGGQLVDALIEAPTASEDGFHIAWNDTNQEYELAAGAAPSTDYWKTVGTSTLTGSVVIDGGFNYNIEIANRTGTGRYVVLGSYDTGFDEIGIAVDGDNYLVRMGYSVDIISDPLAGTVDYGIEASGSYLKFFRGGSEVDFWATSGITTLADANVEIKVDDGRDLIISGSHPDFIGEFFGGSELHLIASTQFAGFKTWTSETDFTSFGLDNSYDAVFTQNASNAGTIKYAADYRSDFVALSLIDKGYADANYISLGLGSPEQVALGDIYIKAGGGTYDFRIGDIDIPPPSNQAFDKIRFGFETQFVASQYSGTTVVGLIALDATSFDIQFASSKGLIEGTVNSTTSWGDVARVNITAKTIGSELVSRVDVGGVSLDKSNVFLESSDVGTFTMGGAGSSISISDTRAGAAAVGLEYEADYSANFGALSLIDKGYADGAYILANTTTNLTASTTIVAAADTIFTFITATPTTGNQTIVGIANSDFAGQIVIWEDEDNNTAAAFQSGGGAATTSFTFDPLNINGGGAGAFFFESGSAVGGLQYKGDYSGGFTDNSLINKGFADGAYFSLDSTNQSITDAGQKILTFGDGNYMDFTAADDLTIFFIGGSKLSVGKGVTMESNVLGTGTDWARLSVTGGNISVEDNKASKRGIEYAAAGYVTQTRSLVDKGYDDSHIGGQLVDALIESPTSGEDGYVITWNDTNNEYELVAGGGGGGWELTGTTEITGNVTIDRNEFSMHFTGSHSSGAGATFTITGSTAGGSATSAGLVAILGGGSGVSGVVGGDINIIAGEATISANGGALTLGGGLGALVDGVVNIQNGITLTAEYSEDNIKFYRDNGSSVMMDLGRGTNDSMTLNGVAPATYGTASSKTIYIHNGGSIDTLPPTTGGGVIASIGQRLYWNSVTTGLVELSASNWGSTTQEGVSGSATDVVYSIIKTTSDTAGSFTGYTMEHDIENDNGDVETAGQWVYQWRSGGAVDGSESGQITARISSNAIQRQWLSVTTTVAGASQPRLFSYSDTAVVSSFGFSGADLDMFLGTGKTFTGQGDYSGDYTSLSFVQKVYADGHIGGQLVDALVETPTVSEDGFVIAWNDTNDEYELVAGGGGGGWELTGTTTLTGAAIIDAGDNYTTFRREDAGTADQLTTFRIERRSTGTTAKHFGNRLEMWADNGAGTLAEQFRIQSRWWDVTNGAEESWVQLQLNDNGTMKNFIESYQLGTGHSTILYAGDATTTMTATLGAQGLTLSTGNTAASVAVTINSTDTSNVTQMAQYTKNSTSTVVAGFGIGNSFQIETDGSFVTAYMNLEVVDAVTATREVNWIFRGQKGANQRNWFTIHPTGILVGGDDSSESELTIQAMNSGDTARLILRSGGSFSNGTMVEVTSGYVGFMGATPIVRQTTTSQTQATYSAVGGTNVDSNDTWNGYTIGDLVAILQAYGLLT